MDDDHKPQGEYRAGGQTDTNSEPIGPESMESLLGRLDVSALKLTVFVKALQALSGRIITHMYGHDGVLPKTEDSKRGPPSLVSLNDDFDTQLGYLGHVIEALVKHVGPFDMDRAGGPKPEHVAVGPGSEAYNH